MRPEVAAFVAFFSGAGAVFLFGAGVDLLLPWFLNSRWRRILDQSEVTVDRPQSSEGRRSCVARALAVYAARGVPSARLLAESLDLTWPFRSAKYQDMESGSFGVSSRNTGILYKRQLGLRWHRFLGFRLPDTCIVDLEGHVVARVGGRFIDTLSRTMLADKKIEGFYV